MKIRIMTLLASAALAMPAVALAAEIPQRGISEARVRADFGSPSSVRGPVGSPAITRWNYDGFTVYFENGITLHTVEDRPASAAPDVVSGSQQTPPPIEEIRPAQREQEAESTPESSTPPMFDPATGRFVGAAGDTSAEEKSATRAAPEPEAQQEPVEPEAEPESISEPQTNIAEEKPEPAPAPQPTPTTEPAASEKPPAEGEFRFDPVTGRIIISGELTPEQAAAKKQQQLEQKAKEAAEEAKAQAEQAEAAVADAEQQVDATANEAAETPRATSEQADTQAQASEEKINEAAEQAEEDTSGGFYIDWGARQ